MTVREIRHAWPKAEKALAEEGEIVVTRDSKPIAKIVSYREAPSARERKPKRFDFKAHMRWLKKISKGETKLPSTDETLRETRYDESYPPDYPRPK